MIKSSAILPNERMKLICEGESVVNVIKADPTAALFGKTTSSIINICTNFYFS